MSRLLEDIIDDIGERLTWMDPDIRALKDLQQEAVEVFCACEKQESPAADVLYRLVPVRQVVENILDRS